MKNFMKASAPGKMCSLLWTTEYQCQDSEIIQGSFCQSEN